MVPTAPTLPIPTGAPEAKPLGPVSQAAPGARPELGRAAVTQPDATRASDGQRMNTALAQSDDIPPDPPPLAGLGIPGLHTARVGDFDKVEEVYAAGAEDKPAESNADAMAPDDRPPGLDRRV